MNKQETLNQIKNLASQSEITLEELEYAFYEGTGSQKPQKLAYKVKISEILYYIGGAIVFIGISIMVFQDWVSMSTLTRILVTLGSGFAAYFVGAVLIRHEEYIKLSYAFFFISVLVIPVGLHVVFNSTGLDVTKASTQSMISAILLFTYLLSYYVYRKNMFLIFSIFYGTWLFFAFTQTIITPGPIDLGRYSEYRLLLTGIVYCLLGYSFLRSKREVLTGPLYALGSLFTLGAALFLTGWSPRQSILWELLYIPLTFTFVFLSVHLKSRSFLSFGALFLILFILKITGQYFTSGLGWPIALIFAGFVVISVGYATVYINKKYLKKGHQEKFTSIA